MSSSTLTGARAPAFRLQNESGEWIALEDLLARGPVMLVFYPGDFTPVCTKQLCSYQDMYGRFVQHGVQIVGISSNDPESHRRFKDRYQFTFHLLSDPAKETFKAYGVTSLFMFGGTSRAVFIIGKSGHILYRYVEPTVVTRRKPAELLDIIEELREKALI